MAVTMKQVRAYLDRDEPDYSSAAQLGVSAVPHLSQLVQGRDSMLAAKATYLTSLIEGDRSNSVLEQAAFSSNREVRVAAAAGIRNIKQPPNSLTEKLLKDQDVGVRKVVLLSIESLSLKGSVDHSRFISGLKDRIEEVARTDKEGFIRELAVQVSKEIK
jgi:hypothetical protein